MAWRMLLRRCPTASMTVVGDVAQVSAPWGSRCWRTVLEQVAPQRSRVRELTVNYRTPSEVMAVAADVLAAVDPDARPPSSVREAGQAPRAHHATDAAATATAVAVAAREQLPDGKLAILCPPAPTYDAVLRAATARFGTDVAAGADGLDAPVAVLTIGEAKGLEFDAVVLVEPGEWLATGEHGLRDLYVALSRTTQRLDVVHTGKLPAVLRGLSAAPNSPAATAADR